MKLSRRNFVKTAVAASALTMPALSYGRVMGTNDKIRVAVVGLNGRGRKHLDEMKDNVVALCDCDQGVLGAAAEPLDVMKFFDYRRLCESNEVDAISIATPNHTHSLIAITAMMAGKDVYCEKPVSHNVWEGRQLVECAARMKRICQSGTQSRSSTALQAAVKAVQSGQFGKIQYAIGTCYKPRTSIGKLDKPLVISDKVDYDLWCGPAEKRELFRPKFHYDWHWDFNTGNGDVGNQGPHEWDMMNWALGDGEALPEKIQASGNRFAWQDAGNTPNIMACRGVMDGIPFLFEVMDLTPGCKPPHDNRVGVVIKTEKGQFVGSRGGGKFIYTDGKEESFKRDAATQKQDGTRAHMANFVDAVLTNDRSKLRSDCKVAAKSSSMAHMANISYQLGQSAEQGQLETAYSGSEQERDMLQRLMTAPGIYSKKHQSDVSESWKLGPELTFDNANKMFKGTQAEPANQKMTREYRKGFELPSMQMQSKAG